MRRFFFPQLFFNGARRHHDFVLSVRLCIAFVLNAGLLLVQDFQFARRCSDAFFASLFAFLAFIGLAGQSLNFAGNGFALSTLAHSFVCEAFGALFQRGNFHAHSSDAILKYAPLVFFFAQVFICTANHVFEGLAFGIELCLRLFCMGNQMHQFAFSLCELCSLLVEFCHCLSLAFGFCFSVLSVSLKARAAVVQIGQCVIAGLDLREVFVECFERACQLCFAL